MDTNTERSEGYRQADSFDDSIHELWQASQFCEGFKEGKDISAGAKTVLRDCGFPENDLEDVGEEIVGRAREMPLETLVRSDWTDIGEWLSDKKVAAHEVRILLMAGGPAVDILVSEGEPPALRYLDAWVSGWRRLATAGPAEHLVWFCNVVGLDSVEF